MQNCRAPWGNRGAERSPEWGCDVTHRCRVDVSAVTTPGSASEDRRRIFALLSQGSVSVTEVHPADGHPLWGRLLSPCGSPRLHSQHSQCPFTITPDCQGHRCRQARGLLRFPCLQFPAPW